MRKVSKTFEINLGQSMAFKVKKEMRCLAQKEKKLAE